MNRVAYLTSTNNVLSTNKLNRNKFILTTCKEQVYDPKLVFYFPKNFFLIEAVNKKIGDYLASGIMSHLIDRYVDQRFWNVKPESKGPQKLSFAHIEGAFMLWSLMLVISGLVLVLELSINFFKKSYQ